MILNTQVSSCTDSNSSLSPSTTIYFHSIENLQTLYEISQSADIVFHRETPVTAQSSRQLSRSEEALNSTVTTTLLVPQIDQSVSANSSHVDLYAKASDHSLEKHLSLFHVTSETSIHEESDSCDQHEVREISSSEPSATNEGSSLTVSSICDIDSTPKKEVVDGPTVANIPRFTLNEEFVLHIDLQKRDSSESNDSKKVQHSEVCLEQTDSRTHASELSLSSADTDYQDLEEIIETDPDQEIADCDVEGTSNTCNEEGTTTSTTNHSVAEVGVVGSVPDVEGVSSTSCHDDVDINNARAISNNGTDTATDIHAGSLHTADVNSADNGARDTQVVVKNQLNQSYLATDNTSESALSNSQVKDESLSQSSSSSDREFVLSSSPINAIDKNGISISHSSSVEDHSYDINSNLTDNSAEDEKSIQSDSDAPTANSVLHIGTDVPLKQRLKSLALEYESGETNKQQTSNGNYIKSKEDGLRKTRLAKISFVLNS